MGILKVKYSELFKVSVAQPFYQNAVCQKYTTDPRPDLEFIPTKECIQRMSRLNLLYKKEDQHGGFTIWGSIEGTSGGNDLLKFKPMKSDALTFLVLLRNPSLANFNDLPQTSLAQAYYFTNQLIDLAASRDDLHLSNDLLGVKSADTIRVTFGTYTYMSMVPVAPGTARVKHLPSGREMLPKSLLTESGKSYLIFDLSSLAPGKCQLLIGGIITEEFYYGGVVADVPIFGIVDFSLDPALQANYRIVEPDGSITPQRPAYRLRFISRQTLWRYRLILQPTSPLFLEMAALSPADKTDFINRLNIVSNDTTILFTGNHISDTVFEFISTSPIQLREKYLSSTGGPHDALSFTLKKYLGDPRESAVRSNLPYPATDRVDATASPTIYSDILLTL